MRVVISSAFPALDIRITAGAENFRSVRKFLASAGFFQPIPTEMADQPTVQTCSDDEPSEDDEVINVEGKDSKKRKATGAAAHMCLKRVEGKRVRLTMEQKAKKFKASANVTNATSDKGNWTRLLPLQVTTKFQ